MLPTLDHLLLGLLSYWVVYLIAKKLIEPGLTKDLKRLEAQHGQLDPARKPHFSLWDKCILAPFGEEISLRGAVLLVLFAAGPIAALAMNILSAVVFSLVHQFNEPEYFADGTEFYKYRQKPVLYYLGMHGFGYGLCVIATGSLWPAIIGHTFNNVRAALADPSLFKKN